MPHGREITPEQLTEAGAATKPAPPSRPSPINTALPSAPCAGCWSRPRRRGKQLVKIEAPDLVLADWHAGLSCRAIADKHGLADHKPVARLLRSHGIDPTSRPARQKVPGVVLGRAVTDRQAVLRGRPPMTIPLRTPEQRWCHVWLQAELEAIGYGLAAGRFTVAPRGRSGLPEPSIVAWQDARIEFWLAMQRVRVAA